MLSGQDTYCFFGSCTEDEATLAQNLSTGTWTLLEDLVYFDGQDRAQGWADWNPNYLARIHLNPAYVISVMPLHADPREKTLGTIELLPLPTGKETKQDSTPAKQRTTTKTKSAKSTQKTKTKKKAAASSKTGTAKKKKAGTKKAPASKKRS